MKLKEGFILHRTKNENVLVGMESTGFNGLIKMNDTAAFIIEQLQKNTDNEAIVKAVKERYDVESDMVVSDIQKVVQTLAAINALEE